MSDKWKLRLWRMLVPTTLGVHVALWRQSEAMWWHVLVYMMTIPFLDLAYSRSARSCANCRKTEQVK